MATNLTIAGYPFICVRLAEADFRDIAAIYVIICVGEDRNWTVLDVGQSGELGTRIDSHTRKECWTRSCPTGNIWVCVYRMPSNQNTKEDRLKLETYIRQQTKPICGSY